MIKILRNIAPFIMLIYSLLVSILSYNKMFIEIIKVYLPDLIGYSIFTNLFMLTLYMNKRYCISIKLAVLGLIILNIFNLIYNWFGISGIVYDIYIAIIFLAVSLTVRYKKIDEHIYPNGRSRETTTRKR